MLCPVCAKEIPEDSSNCPFCGATVPQNSTTPEPVASTPEPVVAVPVTGETGADDLPFTPPAPEATSGPEVSTPISETVAPPAPEPAIPAPIENVVPTPSSAPATVDPKAKNLAIASFVCAIGGFAISWIPVAGFLGLAAEIVAIVFGAMAMKRIPKGGEGRNLAVAGLIVSMVLLAISIIATIIICVATIAMINVGGIATYKY